MTQHSYRVYLHTTASLAIQVEATDEEDAIDQAYDKAPTSVCAQCSGWGRGYSLDLGEWETDDEPSQRLDTEDGAP